MTKKLDKDPAPKWISKEEVEAKAELLSQQHKVKVYPLYLQNDEKTEPVVGYLREPARFVKLRALDESVKGAMTAAATLLESCIIREESDPRIYSEAPENDTYYIGACFEASSIIEMSRNQIKKK